MDKLSNAFVSFVVARVVIVIVVRSIDRARTAVSFCGFLLATMLNITRTLFCNGTYPTNNNAYLATRLLKVIEKKKGQKVGSCIQR